MDRSNISKSLLEKENKRLADENYMFQLTIKHNALLIEQQQETITMMLDKNKNVTSDVEIYKDLLEEAHEEAADNNIILENNNLLIKQQIETITTLLNQNKKLTSELENYRNYGMFEPSELNN